MAPPLTFLLLLLLSPAISLEVVHPTALVLPISKHSSTLQYTTWFNQRTPLVPVNVVLDLNGKFLWISHDQDYNSSSYRLASYYSSQCSLAQASTGRKRSSSNNPAACQLIIGNTFSKTVSVGNLSEDRISLPSTDGLTPGSAVSTQFLFLSAPQKLSEGLASNSIGVAGLGQTTLALPKQLSAAFNFTKKFAICLPPTPDSNGVIFFGDGPYAMLPGIDISKILAYTPLITPNRKDHYYIRVRSVEVNGKRVPINPSSLQINKLGRGGTKISTTVPYSLLESSVYSSFVGVFVREAEAANISRVGSVAPFDVCFSTKARGEFSFRPAMPIIDLILQSKEVFWRIFETNSMVAVGEDVACLGILNGGSSMRASIVIGGHLVEDNLLQFDLESSRLGFSSTLLLRQTSCTNFNFTF